jgi:5-methyltetrahydrofolate--homocysteine methyltransferase
VDGTKVDVAREAPLLLDGAIGTQLLDSGFDPERDWLGHEGCCEVLDLTRPEQVRAVHESYLDAGSDLICTNTFGALRSVLERFGLASRRA